MEPWGSLEIALAGRPCRRYASQPLGPKPVNWRMPHPTEKLPWPQRVILVALGGGLLSLLIVAALLEPDPRGFGTHQRLGLPPCTFRLWTGLRCPSCGMTTSWSHLMRGHVIRALWANAGGLVLGCAALGLAPWALVSGLRGRWWWRPIDERSALVFVLVLALVTLIDWIIRICVGV